MGRNSMLHAGWVTLLILATVANADVSVPGPYNNSQTTIRFTGFC